jgi:hypothetical protein
MNESLPTTSEPKNDDIRLVDIQINDENIALNVMVSFLALAQKRGSFTFDESSKILECIKMFQK